MKLGFRRLLQDPGRGHGQLGIEDKLLGNFVRARKGRSRSLAAWARSSATFACSTASSFDLRSSAPRQ